MKLLSRFFLFCGIAFVISSCSAAGDSPKREAAITMWETEARFIEDFSKMHEPKGIMPSILSIGKGNRDILMKVPKNYFEYFVYDKDKVLVILSFNPFFYLKLESREVISHFESEYLMFKNNIRLSPADKKASARPKYFDFGDLELGVMFTPSEINFSGESSTLNKIMDVDADKDDDPSLILDASKYAVFYTPVFEEEKLFSDLWGHLKQGKERYIYTTESNLFPPNFSEVPFNLNFSFLVCKDIEYTDRMTVIEKKYKDNDYCVLFSMPIGNSSAAKDRNFLSISHGIVITLRGNISNVQDFIAAKGIDFIEKPPITNKLFLHENDENPATVSLDWTHKSNVKIEFRRKDKNPANNPNLWYDTSWITIKDATEEIFFEHTSVERGYHYYYRLTDIETGYSSINDIVIGKDPETTAVVNEVDGYHLAGELVFTEVNLLKSVEVMVQPDGVEQKIARPDRWFEIKNISDRVINLKNIDFYFHRRGEESYPSSEFIFGKSALLIDRKKAVDTYVYPGEYFVIADSLDYMFSEMIIYNICSRNIPQLTEAELTNKDLVMRIGSKVIDVLTLKDVHGRVLTNGRSCAGVYLFHDEFLDGPKFSWLNSQTPFLMINPNSGFGLYNYCTPGERGFEEY